MKKLSFLISGLLLTSGIYAQQPEEIVVLDYDDIPLVSSAAPGNSDVTSPTRNPDPSGINESARVGKYVHKNNMWVTEEQQVGKKNPNIPEIDLRYYTGIELKAYVPSETNTGLFWLELKSDGPDFGAGDPNVQRENWERQFIAYPSIPMDNDANLLLDQWFKIEYNNIKSSRKLGMVAFGYRRGQPVSDSSKEIVYFDDITMKLTESPEVCLFRESFFLFPMENKAWEDNPNADITLYPGTDWAVPIEKGADRWVSGYEPKTDLIALDWDTEGYGHYLILDKSLQPVMFEDIDISGGFTDLKLVFDIKGSIANAVPKIEYKLDGGDWTEVNIGTVTKNWQNKVLPIGSASANKISIRLSGQSMASGMAHVDNLTVLGIDGVSISKVNIDKVKIYPNPVTDILNVEGDVERVELYNAQGRMVYSGAVDGGVDVSHFPTGVYVVKVYTLDGVSSTKVLKK